MHIITDILEHDNKRNKVILDEGGLAFLLYKGECRHLGIKKNDELSDEKYEEIMAALLLRGKRRALYYLKDEDKTEYRIREKLKQGLYPEEIIDKVMDFLVENQYADEKRYADRMVSEFRGQLSRAMIKAKMFQRLVQPRVMREALAELTEEDEINAARYTLKKCTSKNPYYYLSGRGFSWETAKAVIEESGYAKEQAEYLDN